MKRKFYKSHIIIGTILFLVFLALLLLSHNVYFHRYNTYALKINDMSNQGYIINDNKIVSASDDANLEQTFSNPITIICVQIDLVKPLSKDDTISVYFNTGKGYSESKCVTYKANETDKTKIILSVNSKNISSIRLDFGNEKNQEYTVNEMSVNPTESISKQRASDIVALIIRAFELAVICIICYFIIINIKSIFKKLINNIIKFKNYILSGKRFIYIIVGIFILSSGFIFEALVCVISSSKHDTNNYDIDLKSAISSNISINNNVITALSDNCNVSFDVGGKYIKELGILSGNGRGAKYDVYINGNLINRTNANDSDPYGSVKTNNIIPVVYLINNNVSQIKLVLSKDVSISQLHIMNHINYNYPRALFISLSVFVLYCLVVFIKKKNVKVENLFLIISLSAGTLFALTMPMNTGLSWDDQIHFYNVIRMYSSRTQLKENEQALYTFKEPITFSLNEHKYISSFLSDSNEINGAGISTIDSIYANIGYLPSASAFIVGKLLRLPFSFIFILGRWINVLVFALVVYWAIRRLKSGKVIMAIIALFPTTVFLASNYSYDSWVIAFAMLGFSFFFSELQQPNKKLELSDCIIMIGSFVLALGPKAIYFPLLLILLLLKPEKFYNLKNYKRFKVCVIVSTIVVASSFMLPFLVSGPGSGDLRGGAGVNSALQVEYIFGHPFEYTYTLLSFLCDYLSIKSSASYISLLGYLGFAEMFYLSLALLIVAVFTDKNRCDKYVTTKKIRFWSIIIIFSTVCLLSTALYVGFTPVGLNSIAGVQLRYLLPVLFPIFMIIGSSRINNRMNRNVYNSIMLMIPAFILFFNIWTKLVRLYY